MRSWGPEETNACARLVSMALEEDLGTTGDLTSHALIPPDLRGKGVFVVRSAGVIAGLAAVRMVFQSIDPNLVLEIEHEDGEEAPTGERLATVNGRMTSILGGERIALNFLQRLSGIATLTHLFVQAIANLPCRILDTRKTTPGWRRLEKYAVRCGGGHNHRQGLYDAILIKDNHLAALKGVESSIADAVRRAKRASTEKILVEIEVDTLEQLDAALAAQPDFVLLDNMDPATLREAVRRRNQHAPGVHLEASGGITLENVHSIAETGVDCISVGALTHSATALDIALDYA